jgi:hypothetical protein
MILPIWRLLLLFALTAAPGVLPAQDSTAARVQPTPMLEGLSLGGTVDRYLVGGVAYTAISFRGVTFKPACWTPEFAFGLLPEEGDHNRAALTTDLGTAYGIGLPGSLLLLKAGSTGIFDLSEGGTLVGGYGGVGVVAPLGGRVGLRLEATRRWYLVAGAQPPVWVLSLGLTSIPLRR